MNPADCNPNDWSLYFNNSFMMHCDHGPVRVNVDGGCFYIITSEHESELVEPDTLTTLWPRPGCINVGSNAYYVDRQASREARRSATSHHYHMLNSNQRFTLEHMRELVNPTYPSIDAAMDALANGDCLERAISRDIFIQNSGAPDSYMVACRGIFVGNISNTQPWVYTPGVNSQYTKRVAHKLLQLGIECH
jgi:hypothetical protein